MKNLTKQTSIFALALTIALVCTGVALAASLSYFQGFETDTAGWNANTTRVASGTAGIVSASGSWHAQAGSPNTSFTNWGGSGGNAGCFATACAAASFPKNGYVTSVDIWLDASSTTFANDTRFDFSSAISNPAGSHRRDFVFNAGFYNDSDTTGTGPRFVISASTNSGRSNSFPKNPDRAPFAITEDGWYTFEHTFRDNAGILEVDLKIKDEAGTTLTSWTISDPSDTINGNVGGNRYGWFALQEFPVLAFDNASKFDIKGTPADKEQCKKGGWMQVVDGDGEDFTNQGQCVKFVNSNS